jgi:AcrR family transcriptional regulator
MPGLVLFGSPRRDKGAHASESRSQGKQTREAILAQALKIAAREGLAALTIGRLAKELRMSKSGLFAHFRSKQALELATVEEAGEVFADAVLGLPRPAAKASRNCGTCAICGSSISNAEFFRGPISSPAPSLNIRTGPDPSPQRSVV